ncbi:MAG TPA: hypothetical protein VKS82_23610 [Streptosporangiaceae bacterium]|nr:hypothetical protein [Streptosporangiaceae bacterium]
MKAYDSGALSAEDLLALARLDDDGAPAAPAAAAGTARITQLRRVIRRARPIPDAR